MTSTLFLDALHGRNKRRPPVWLMRQAGRYMPSYRAIRQKLSFLEMCYRPEVIAEVTLLPIREFGMDAAILFSDILLLPNALGLELSFEEGEGPQFAHPIRSVQQIQHLPQINFREALAPVLEGIKLLRSELKVPLIGFAGAPFTVASYMIEGRSSHNWRTTKQWIMRQPEAFDHLIQLLTEQTIQYLKLQAQAGVQAVQLFDSWADILNDVHFNRYCVEPLKKIVQALKESQVPLIAFSRGSALFATQLAEACPTGLSLDWRCDLKKMRQTIPREIALQGNLDPDWLYAPLDRLALETDRLLDAMHSEPAYIFNLGHGIAPDMTPDAVKCIVERVQMRG